MSNLETPEDLLVRQRSQEISPQRVGEPIVGEFPPAKEASRVDGEPAKLFQPVEPTIAEVPTSLGKISLVGSARRRAQSLSQLLYLLFRTYFGRWYLILGDGEWD
jgi:hypothetical protein